jgi:hypothetical protein
MKPAWKRGIDSMELSVSIDALQLQIRDIDNGGPAG